MSPAKRGDGLVTGGEDAEGMLEAGDLEDAADLLVLAAEDEPALAAVPRRGVDPLPGADDQGDAGRIDELAVGKVDQDGGVLRLDRLLERTFQLRSRRKVQLAMDLDESDTTLQLGSGCLKRRGTHWPRC